MTESVEYYEKEAVNFAKLAVENDRNNKIETSIFYYSEAVESILNALRLGSHNQALQDKATIYIQRAETLKSNIRSESPKIVSEQNKEKSVVFYMLDEALKEDEEGNIAEALKLYEESIAFLLKLSNNASNDKEKNDLRTAAKNALDRAENLKKEHLASLSTQTTKAAGAVSQIGQALSSDEVSVLKSTSVINGRQYLPFIDFLDYKERFSYLSPFNDKNGLLALSDKQKSYLLKWVRPSEISDDPKMIMAVSYFSICQTIVTDCSFVASIAVAAQYERKFQKKLITNIIYPQDRFQKCVYNPCGKYMIKLNINGVPRKIIIDDLLPMGKNGKLLCSYSSNRGEMWVSLIEKAYMKVMGGYDFPGSNSNIDLHALTGWIPERIPIVRNDPIRFKVDKEFKKLHEHFHKGNCLITVATGNLSDAEAERAGLVSTHAYAMLDIREIDGRRLLMLKNPWSHLRWKGNFSDNDTTNWTPSLQKALNFDLSAAKNVDNGVFWIDYDSLQHFFDVIYVSWSPFIFPFTTCVHDKWLAAEGPKKDIFSIAQNPQYRLHLQNPRIQSSLWILLTRHITDKDDFANNREFIALMVYRGISSNQSKIFYPNDPAPIIDGVRLNSPHYLVKKIHDPEKDGGNEYILVISQYEKSNNLNFTLRVYGTTQFSLSKIIDPYKYYKTVSAEWNSTNAGGCPNNRETYMKNPVFQLKLNNTSLDNRIMIEIKAPKNFAVGFDIICVEEYNTSNPNGFKQKSSGDYRKGFLVCEYANLSGGLYNIRVATYYPNQDGPFILKIGSIRDIMLYQLS